MINGELELLDTFAGTGRSRRCARTRPVVNMPDRTCTVDLEKGLIMTD